MTIFGWPNVSFAKVSVKIFDWTPEIQNRMFCPCLLFRKGGRKRIANAEIFDFDGALIDRILR